MPKRGDVVLVPFPFTDLSGQKVRPAIVISSPKKGDDVVVVFISSQQKKKMAATIVIEPTKQNGIKVSSVIVCNKIATLDAKVIIGGIGSVESAMMQKVDGVLRTVLGLE